MTPTASWRRARPPPVYRRGNAAESAIMSKGARLRRTRLSERQEAAAAASHARTARRDASKRGAEEGVRRGCLFCRKSDGGFTGEEHIFPESLGNNELVLPIGVVCDRCNHGVLSELDQALAGFLPIEMMRTWHGIPSKTGRLPSFKFDNGSLRCVAPGQLHLMLDSRKGQPATPPAPAGKKSSLTQRPATTPDQSACATSSAPC